MARGNERVQHILRARGDPAKRRVSLTMDLVTGIIIWTRGTKTLEMMPADEDWKTALHI